MRRLLILSLIAVAAPAAAQQAESQPASQEATETASARPPQRIRNIMLKDGEKCPAAQGDEIVVCGRLDPDEMYRIPKQFREPPYTPANNAWVNRAQTIMDVNRVGMPNSCSPVGTGGQTGCSQMMIDNWYAARREQRSEAARVP
jgi:hypothetical protein